MNTTNRFLLGALIVLGILASDSFYIVNQWENAIRLQFGKVITVQKEPGLHFKVPFIQNVRKFDIRIQTLETKPERFLTEEKKNLIVDTFVKWRVADPVLFYQRVQGSAQVYNSRLDPIIKDSFRAEFGRRELQEVVAGFNQSSKQTVREEIQQSILKRAKEAGNELGVEIIDARIKGVELPTDVRNSVYERMETERQTVAETLIAEGEAKYIEIVADAQRQRRVKMAEAYQKAELIRGDGDGVATNVYAEAYNKNKEFYEFYRSLEAYRKSFKSKGDMFILDPKTKFFKHFYEVN